MGKLFFTKKDDIPHKSHFSTTSGVGRSSAGNIQNVIRRKVDGPYTTYTPAPKIDYNFDTKSHPCSADFSYQLHTNLKSEYSR